MLDRYEQEIEDALEAGDFEEVEDQKKYELLAKEAAKNFLKKSERINIRISAQDLQYIKAIAVEEGLPYQTLVSSVLHKFVKSKFSGENSTT